MSWVVVLCSGSGPLGSVALFVFAFLIGGLDAAERSEDDYQSFT